MRVLILGGYGVFGGRLAELVADVPALTLLIARRSLAAAQAFCARYSGPAQVRPCWLLPDSISAESEREGRLCFDVRISAPLAGLIVAYRGALAPDGLSGADPAS